MADVLAQEAAARMRIIEEVYRDPQTGFGSMANTLKAAKARNPFVTRDEVRRFFETLRDRQDRPQRGYNSFVPQEPMHEVQVDLAFMSAFGGKPVLKHLCALERSAETRSSVQVKKHKAAQATASSGAYRTGQLQAEQSSWQTRYFGHAAGS